METFDGLLLVLLLSVNFCLQCVEGEEACWFKCDKNKKCVYHPKEERKVCVLKRCLKPKSHGFCRRYTQRYYFDHKTFECKCFKYGGCYGSRNNFLTKHSCESRCFPPPLEKSEGFTTALSAASSTLIPTLTPSPFTAPTTSIAARISILMANPAPTTATDTTATTTPMAATAPVSLRDITEPTTSTVTRATLILRATPNPTTPTATTIPLGVTTTPVSPEAATSPLITTNTLETTTPTARAAPTTPMTTIALTTPTTTMIQTTIIPTSSSASSTCKEVSSVMGLTFFPSGGANLGEKKAYRCENMDHTFDIYSFATMVCPIISCQSDGTYLPASKNKCTVPVNSPPGDDTLTIPGTITSPDYDGINNYEDGDAQYRWNIVTVGSKISISFRTLDLPNPNSYCARSQGDVIEIYCGFKSATADFKFCNSKMPSTTIYCQQPCVVILLVLNSDYATGLGFSLIWSLVN